MLMFCVTQQVYSSVCMIMNPVNAKQMETNREAM